MREKSQIIIGTTSCRLAQQRPSNRLLLSPPVTIHCRHSLVQMIKTCVLRTTFRIFLGVVGMIKKSITLNAIFLLYLSHCKKK